MYKTFSEYAPVPIEFVVYTRKHTCLQIQTVRILINEIVKRNFIL